jgi:hypothetical protein
MLGDLEQTLSRVVFDEHWPEAGVDSQKGVCMRGKRLVERLDCDEPGGCVLQRVGRFGVVWSLGRKFKLSKHCANLLNDMLFDLAHTCSRPLQVGGGRVWVDVSRRGTDQGRG